MLNLSDKELDRLSREAAEQFEPDEEFSSWEKLEQQLSREIEDKPPATPTRFRARPIGYGALLLLLVGTSYFLLKTGNDSKSSTLKNKAVTEANQSAGNSKNSAAHPADAINKTADASKNNESVGGSTGSNDAATPGESSSSSKSKNNLEKNNEGTAADRDGIASQKEKSGTRAVEQGVNAQKNIDGLQSNVANKNRNHNRPPNDKFANAAIASSAGIASANSIQGSGRKNKNSVSNGTPQEAGVVDQENSSAMQSGKKNPSANGFVASDETDKPKYATLPELAFSNSVIYVSDTSLAKEAAKADNYPAPVKNQSLHMNRSLKIGLMFAPDYTKVGSASSDKLSTAIGITLGYQLDKHWSVNTGLIYTKKNYSSTGKDFHWYYPGFKTESTDGNCSMWEIPLSLRYDFSSVTKNKFFINAGLSSYLMKHESYALYGTQSYGPWQPPMPDTKYVDVNSHQNYLFSIATVSAGFEHSFNQRFSLQVEPFVKIPLTGVGLGSLQLNSYGISFSLRYAPLLSKSRH